MTALSSGVVLSTNIHQNSRMCTTRRKWHFKVVPLCVSWHTSARVMATFSAKSHWASVNQAGKPLHSIPEYSALSVERTRLHRSVIPTCGTPHITAPLSKFRYYFAGVEVIIEWNIWVLVPCRRSKFTRRPERTARRTVSARRVKI